MERRSIRGLSFLLSMDFVGPVPIAGFDGRLAPEGSNSLGRARPRYGVENAWGAVP